MADDEKWFCADCGVKVADSREDAINIGVCQKCGGKNASRTPPEKPAEWEILLDKDKKKNPYLFLISEHLWWVALSVKLGLTMMLISIFLMLASLG